MLADRLIKDTGVHMYLAPHPLLRPYIAHYTITVATGGRAESETLALIPDASGCLIFTFGWKNPSSTLWGPTTKTVVVNNDLAAAPTRLFVEFLPGGLYALTGQGQHELANLQLPLAQIMPTLAGQIGQAFEQSRTLDNFLDTLENLLLRLILPRQLPEGVIRALKGIKSTKGMLNVASLAEQAHYSQRHLNRLFHDYVGMNVKTFARLTRINTVVQQINQPFTDLAQQSGFYDQAHFIHEFRAVCQTTPGQYLLNLSDFYNETLKF